MLPGSIATGSNEDRLARRRARRWRRRAELLAPLLAVPAMLGVLALSVNLIEHAPDAKAGARSNPRAESVAGAASAQRAAETERASIPSAPGDVVALGTDVDAHALSQQAVIATAVAADMPLATELEPRAAQSALFGVPAPTGAFADPR